MSRTLTIPARPEPIAIDPAQTAVVVVDMQNAYCSKGGYFDLFGMDISGAAAVIKAINTVLPPSRAAGMPVVYFQMGWDRDLVEAGGPSSPNYHKANALRLMRQRPELRGTLLTRGTWDYAIVDDLKPQPQDYIVQKPRYSGFSGTNLDNYLRHHGIRNLVLTGIATNVCVESTLRDAFFLEYFPILIADCTHQAGPPEIQKAVLFTVETFLGWVTTSREYVEALRSA
jgi:ureidoacrylate peracid hydrolase